MSALLSPRVLLVDDNDDVLDSFEDLLGGGFLLGRAKTRDEAIEQLETKGPWDVVLVDERLEGPSGGESAVATLSEVSRRFPDAHAIVVTGYARKDLIEAAFAAGAWDYLQKDAFIGLLLPRKVQQAAELAVARRLARTAPAEVEGALQAAWADARSNANHQAKGPSLEQALKLLFHTMPGLDHVRTNFRNDVEELDLVVRNESDDPLLAKEGSLWLVECKNWSKAVDPQTVTAFRNKLRNRHGRVKLGIFVALSGFTRNVATELSRQSNEDELVVTVTGNELADWIAAADRLAWLKAKVEAAMLRAGGG